MPPEPATVPLPNTLSSDAMDWLDSQGLVAQTPWCRASDYDVSLADPFLYYLTRRLGITPTAAFPSCLSIGSWNHARFEFFAKDEAETHSALNARLEERIASIEERCNNANISPDKRREILETERQNYLTALTIYEASVCVPFGKDNRTINSYLRRPEWRLLPPETLLTVKYPGMPRTMMACRPDRLAYHEGHNSLWIIDYKTTSYSPVARLSVCPNEFATVHYFNIVKSLFESGALFDAFPDLPKNLTLGGVIHIAVRKPLIRLSQKDRNFTVQTKVLKSGPRKGQEVAERIYEGEPRLDNYRQRMVDWYFARGDYVDLRGEWDRDPPVNQSFTYASYLNHPVVQERYHEQVTHLYTMATKTALPLDFLPKSNLLSMHGVLSPFTPFYIHPVYEWPRIIRENNFLILHREDEDKTFNDDEPAPLTQE